MVDVVFVVLLRLLLAQYRSFSAATKIGWQDPTAERNCLPGQYGIAVAAYHSPPRCLRDSSCPGLLVCAVPKKCVGSAVPTAVLGVSPVSSAGTLQLRVSSAGLFEVRNQALRCAALDRGLP